MIYESIIKEQIERLQNLQEGCGIEDTVMISAQIGSWMQKVVDLALLDSESLIESLKKKEGVVAINAQANAKYHINAEHAGTNGEGPAVILIIPTEKADPPKDLPEEICEPTALPRNTAVRSTHEAESTGPERVIFIAEEYEPAEAFLERMQKALKEEKRREMLEKIVSILKQNELTTWEAVEALNEASSIVQNRKFI